MKLKNFIIVLALILTVTGCGSTKNNNNDIKTDNSKLTCTSTDEAAKSTYVFNFDDNDDLKSIDITLEFTKDEYAQTIYSIFSAKEEYNAKIEGTKVTYNESVETFKNGYDLEKASKDKVKEAFEQSDEESFVCK